MFDGCVRISHQIIVVVFPSVVRFDLQSQFEFMIM